VADHQFIMVRTSVVNDDGRWLVRVRVEQEEKLLGPDGKGLPVFVGPFKDEADADLQGRKIAKLVKQAFGVADA
jgi:hypothetical protein